MKILLFALSIFSITAFGQIPEGYYDSAQGLSGQQLRAALQDIIDNHQEQSYASIWTHFQSTDDNINGKVWDMYSDVPGGNPAYIYSFLTDQCGNYSAEGDCYNREHSFPQSWFNDAAPMVTDLFQIYPTDGYVNGKRSNYPYGEVTSPSWISTNGCKLGNCSFTGYSGTVFEPVDEYKGDLARTYFYMMTRYMDIADGWNSDMLSGNDLAPWAKELLVKWNSEDPVSQKEEDRNNAVYQIQDNRNPYIDHPEYTDLIWGLPSELSENNFGDVKVWYSKGNIHIESKHLTKGKLRIINLGGMQLANFQINAISISIPFYLNEGFYLLLIETSKQVETYKLVIIENN